uniref:Uncharacterized protein n=1 Tax=Tanacetum cinerariifolium TaxID=118510 RepID=A0A6L2NDA6_TANCI|nr:hypothetical protein [Tanacetum cinerariifolium]
MVPMHVRILHASRPIRQSSQGWIFGSVSENVLVAIIDLASTREVWDKLKSFYDATNSPQQALHILDQDKDLVREAISSDGSTVLDTTVGVDGSTALHIAATVGNTHAADHLVKNNKSLLKMKDGDGEDPLDKAYKYMHLDTIGYLLNANKIDAASQGVSVRPDIGVDLLVNAISAKNYSE